MRFASFTSIRNNCFGGKKLNQAASAVGASEGLFLNFICACHQSIASCILSQLSAEAPITLEMRTAFSAVKARFLSSRSETV
jgi:hypothetical protein